MKIMSVVGPQVAVGTLFRAGIKYGGPNTNPIAISRDAVSPRNNGSNCPSPSLKAARISYANSMLPEDGNMSDFPIRLRELRYTLC